MNDDFADVRSEPPSLFPACRRLGAVPRNGWVIKLTAIRAVFTEPTHGAWQTSVSDNVYGARRAYRCAERTREGF